MNEQGKKYVLLQKEPPAGGSFPYKYMYVKTLAHIITRVVQFHQYTAFP